MIRKSKASFEVWGKLTGTIDTKEKFELVLQILRVWKKDKQCTPEQLYILKTLI